MNRRGMLGLAGALLIAVGAYALLRPSAPDAESAAARVPVESAQRQSQDTSEPNAQRPPVAPRPEPAPAPPSLRIDPHHDPAPAEDPDPTESGTGTAPGPDDDLVDSRLWRGFRERGVPEEHIGAAVDLMMRFGADPSDSPEEAKELMKDAEKDGYVPPGAVVITDDELEGKSIEEIRALLRARAKAAREADEAEG